ncbi:hypothetical protein ACF0MN_10995 [Legionella pneumophila]|uniref:hypothetical protein n=1 Tax=Legionella pneumophila TaxID=446 RepID=UPI0036F47439
MCEELQRIKQNLSDVIKVQCSKGNYDCNAYMFGLANGLILAQSIVNNERPEYMEQPEQFLDDLPKIEHVLCIDGEGTNE